LQEKKKEKMLEKPRRRKTKKRRGKKEKGRIGEIRWHRYFR
jgi:hypothetical protein